MHDAHDLYHDVLLDQQQHGLVQTLPPALSGDGGVDAMGEAVWRGEAGCEHNGYGKEVPREGEGTCK